MRLLCQSHPTPRIVLRNNKPIWMNQPIELNSDWPVINDKIFRRLLKKGWLQEARDFIFRQYWVASELGKNSYLSTGPSWFRMHYEKNPKPTVSKYRKAILRRIKHLKFIAKYDKKQEPEPILRKEHKRTKPLPEKYHRQENKRWTQYEEDQYKQDQLPEQEVKCILTVREALNLVNQMGKL